MLEIQALEASRRPSQEPNELDQQGVAKTLRERSPWRGDPGFGQAAGSRGNLEQFF